MRLTSTREAIHDALASGYLHQGGNSLVEFLTYETRIDKTESARDHNVDFLEAGYIRAAINQLDHSSAQWLKFCYGPDDSIGLQRVLAADLRRDWTPIISSKKRARLFVLAQATLEGYRLRIWQQRDFTNELYALRLGVCAAHWARDWAKAKDGYLKKIRSWDIHGISHISRMIRALNGKSDLTPSEILSEPIAKW